MKIAAPDTIRIEGYVIVSADGMIADRDGVMPDALKIPADQKFLHAALDRAAAVVHGRLSHESGPRAAERRRVVVTRTVPTVAPDPDNPKAVRWNPAGATLADALEALHVREGLLAVLGGTEVFGLFLPAYHAFHLSCAGKVRLPGGRPVFPQVPAQTPEEVLASHGLVPVHTRILQPALDCTVVTWERKS